MNDTEYKTTQSTYKYDLLVKEDGTKGIKCKRCGMTSWHPLDVRYRYCINCKLFICTLAEVLGE
jgi:hypothetical protein